LVRAVILLAHGSRDPLWRRPVEAVAQRLAERGMQAGCAYLELEQPDLAACAGELAASGAQAITIVPMFLGTGKHAREDLPVLVARLRADHPAVAFTLQQAVGEDSRVLDLLAAIALE
jgi:sirohydrochlorin cobaltochelatase